VPKSDRFGDVLERLYADDGRKVRVFSLGVRSAGPARYLESLALVPETCQAGLVIFSFYPNDIAPRPRTPALRRGLAVAWALSRSSLTFRVVHDILARVERPTVAHYHQSIVDDYQPDDPTFPGRWAELVGALTRFHAMAARRSVSRPLFLILPMMVDYRDYPLEHAHAMIRKTAEGLGYDVLDLLSDFRAALGDGTRYRARPNDNHFNAQVHALVAALIKRRLDERRQ
jgi:hypothetical protein